MPHCIIEYSEELGAELTPSKLLNAVYQGAVESQLFEPDDIKTRALAFKDYMSGESKQNFVHVTLKILSGRNAEQRSHLSRSVINELKKICSSPASLTVEVCEIERSSYAKVAG